MRRDVGDAVRRVLLVGVTWLTGCAGTVSAPYPPIRADTSAAALERGAAIFHASCESCHRGGDSEQAAGAPLRELPSYMGDFYAANLTSHPTAGIGSLKDEELARAIRFAVSRDGRLMVMPSYGMGDADLAAVLGFMRSEDPLFTPVAKPAPRSEFSFFGGIGFRFITGNEPVERPVSGIPVPPKAATREYGRYMAHDVYDCASCHTDGFSPNKTHGDDVFAGGMSFIDPEGRKVYSSNITFHETGLANWTLADFTRAVRDGLAPDGSALRSPMPRFRAMDAVEAQAIYDFLRAQPPRDNEVKGARPRLTATSERKAWASAQGTGEGVAAGPTGVAATATSSGGSTEAASAPPSGTRMPPQPAADGTAAAPASKPGTASTGAASTVNDGTASSRPEIVTNTSATNKGTSIAPNTSAATAKTGAGVSTPVATRPAAPLKTRTSEPKVDAPKLFVQLGCSSCHAPGARYHDRLVRAKNRTDAELVRWVRNPEQFLPGTPMPTYAELLDEKTALAIVRWVKAGGPKSLPASPP